MSEIFMSLVWYYDISLYDGANGIMKYMLCNFLCLHIKGCVMVLLYNQCSLIMATQTTWGTYEQLK